MWEVMIVRKVVVVCIKLGNNTIFKTELLSYGIMIRHEPTGINSIGYQRADARRFGISIICPDLLAYSGVKLQFEKQKPIKKIIGTICKIYLNIMIFRYCLSIS